MRRVGSRDIRTCGARSSHWAPRHRRSGRRRNSAFPSARQTPRKWPAYRQRLRLTLVIPVARVADRPRGYSSRGRELFECRVPFSVLELVDDRKALEMQPRSFGQIPRAARERKRFVHFNSWCSYRCVRIAQSQVRYRSKGHAMIPNRHSFKALQITRGAMVTASVISADALPFSTGRGPVSQGISINGRIQKWTSGNVRDNRERSRRARKSRIGQILFPSPAYLALLFNDAPCGHTAIRGTTWVCSTICVVAVDAFTFPRPRALRKRQSGRIRWQDALPA